MLVNATHEVRRGTAYAGARAAGGAGQLRAWKDNNNILIDAGACKGHPLRVREVEVCVNGVVMHCMVLMSEVF